MQLHATLRSGTGTATLTIVAVPLGAGRVTPTPARRCGLRDGRVRFRWGRVRRGRPWPGSPGSASPPAPCPPRPASQWHRPERRVARPGGGSRAVRPGVHHGCDDAIRDRVQVAPSCFRPALLHVCFGRSEGHGIRGGGTSLHALAPGSRVSGAGAGGAASSKREGGGSGSRTTTPHEGQRNRLRPRFRKRNPVSWKSEFGR